MMHAGFFVSFLGWMSFRVVESRYIQWDIDPRCPDEDRRQLQDDTEDRGVRGSYAEEDNPLEQQDVDADDLHRNRELGTNPVTFNFKLYWQQGYCWQQEWRERQWCLECPGTTCSEDEFLWINECNQYDALQRFEWVQLGTDGYTGQNQGLLKVASQNLCVEQTEANVFRLKTCNEYEINQKLIGFHMTQHFQIGPAHVNHLSDCLTQDHHPKPYEELISQPCYVASKHRTSFWEVYKPSEAVVSIRLPKCSPSLQCEECQGDCSEDWDCRGTLRCFQRGRHNVGVSIPGCSGVPLAHCK